MPVTSTRRYSSSYLPSSSTSSSVGTYRSSNFTSSTSSSLSKDYSSTTPRITIGDSSYRSYRPSLTSSGFTSSYRSSRYDIDDADKNKYSSSSLSTRIGVSKTSSSRFKSDTLPPLPPNASSSSSLSALTLGTSKRSTSRSRDVRDSGESSGPTKNGDRCTNGKLSLMNDLDFYEKYSPSRYMTKYELTRSRSLSETAQTPTRDNNSPPPSSSQSLSNDSPTHTPKSEVCPHMIWIILCCRWSLKNISWLTRQLTILVDKSSLTRVNDVSRCSWQLPTSERGSRL